MSFFNSIESAVTQLKSAIGSELNATERNLEQLIKAAATDVDNEFEKVFTKIRHVLDSVEQEVETKVQNVDHLLIEAKNEIEKGAETAYQTFITKTEDEIRRIKHLASESITAMNTAGKYIKDKAEYDVKHSLDVAKTAFENAKNTFEDDVSRIVDGAIAATKKGVKRIVDDAREGGQKLNQLRVEVDDEIKGKFHAIEDDLISMKSRFSSEMDEIVSFGKREVSKMEKKFESLAVTAKSVSNTIALATICFCFAAGLGIIFIKERNHGAEFEQWKREKSRSK